MTRGVHPTLRQVCTRAIRACSDRMRAGSSADRRSTQYSLTNECSDVSPTAVDAGPPRSPAPQKKRSGTRMVSSGCTGSFSSAGISTCSPLTVRTMRMRFSAANGVVPSARVRAWSTVVAPRSA